MTSLQKLLKVLKLLKAKPSNNVKLLTFANSLKCFYLLVQGQISERSLGKSILLIAIIYLLSVKELGTSCK